MPHPSPCVIHVHRQSRQSLYALLSTPVALLPPVTGVFRSAQLRCRIAAEKACGRRRSLMFLHMSALYSVLLATPVGVKEWILPDYRGKEPDC